MEIYELNLCSQSEYRKIRTRNNSVFGHFLRSGKYTVIGDKQLQKKWRGHFEQHSAHQAKMLCNMRGWLEWKQGALQSFFWILQTKQKFVRPWNKVKRKFI